MFYVILYIVQVRVKCGAVCVMMRCYVNFIQASHLWCAAKCDHTMHAHALDIWKCVCSRCRTLNKHTNRTHFGHILAYMCWKVYSAVNRKACALKSQVDYAINLRTTTSSSRSTVASLCLWTIYSYIQDVSIVEEINGSTRRGEEWLVVKRLLFPTSWSSFFYTRSIDTLYIIWSRFSMTRAFHLRALFFIYLYISSSPSSSRAAPLARRIVSLRPSLYINTHTQSMRAFNLCTN